MSTLPLKVNQKEIGKYRRRDRIAYAGGAHLLPENHSSLLRLDALSLACCLAQEEGTKSLNGQNFTALANKIFDKAHPLRSMEDPNDNLFTQNIVFHGGNFIVYPGIDEAGAYPLQALLKALFKSDDETLKKLAASMYETVLFSLAISHAMALRLEHTRNLEGSIQPSRDFALIGAAAGRTLASAVTFQADDLERIKRRFNLKNCNIDDLVFDPNSEAEHSADPNENPLTHRPFVQLDDTLIVAVPTSISYALRAFIWEKARALEGASEILSKRLGNVYMRELLKYFYVSGYDHTEPPTPSTSPIPQVSEYFFRIDLNKLAVVFVVIDSDTYGNSAIGNDAISEWLAIRRKEIIKQLNGEQLFSIILPVATQLELFLFGFNFDDNSPRLMASFYDLLLCSTELAEHSLALWKYCRLKDSISDSVLIQAFSFAEEFGLYSAKDRSFYVSDESRPNLISISPGDCHDFIHRALVIPDVHSAYKPSLKAFREVRRISRDQIPIYAPTSPSNKVEHLIEHDSLTIWITFDAEDPNSENLSYSPVDLIDCFSYWCLSVLGATSSLTPDRHRTVELEIIVHHDEKSARENYPEETKHTLEISGLKGFAFIVFSGSSWQIHLSHSFVEEIRQKGNFFDQLVVKAIYRAIRCALFDPPPEYYFTDDEEKVITVLTANSNRKKIFVLDSAINRCLDPRNLVPPRYVDSHDIGEHLDALATYLEEEGHTPGSIDLRDDRISITRKIALFFGIRALDIIKALDSEKTLRLLLGLHDSLVSEQIVESTSRQYTNACYYELGKYKERLYKDTQRATKAALAMRAIAEMCASQKSSGTQEPTYEIIDQLLGLGELIVNWGRISDEIQYDLVPHDLAVLPTLRIGLNHKVARAGYGSFYEDKIAEETQVLQREARDRPEDEEILNLLRGDTGKEAFLAEFGLSVEEFILVSDLLFEIALKNEDSVAILTASDLTQAISQIAERPIDDLVDRTINAFGLAQRDDYFKAPTGFNPSDIFPWRYNRLLSLTRRPLVTLSNDGKTRFMFGARTTLRSLQRLFSSVTGGNLNAKSRKMKEFLGRINKLRGDRFNSECIEWFKTNSNYKVESKITISPTGHITATTDQGDIDVFLVDDQSKTIFAIECKEVNFAREPHQIHSEWLDIDPSSPESWIAKHSTRHETLSSWLKNGGSCNFGEYRGFKVHSLVLTSETLPTPYLKEIPMPMISMSQLRLQGLDLIKSVTKRS